MLKAYTTAVSTRVALQASVNDHASTVGFQLAGKHQWSSYPHVQDPQAWPIVDFEARND